MCEAVLCLELVFTELGQHIINKFIITLLHTLSKCVGDKNMLVTRPVDVIVFF